MFSSTSVKQLLDELDVLVVTADGTKSTPEFKKDLGRSNRDSLPVNLIYPADPSKPAIMLPEYLTPSIVIEALNKAAKE